MYGYASTTRGGAAGDDPQWLDTTFAGFPEPVPTTVAALLEDRHQLALLAPVCVPQRGLPRRAPAAYLASGLLEEAFPLRPAASALLGPAGRSA